MNRCLSVLLLTLITISSSFAQERQRARDYGITPGILTPGKMNSITDVTGVSVGHSTIIEGDSIRTGVTVVFPHQENLFRNRVPAAVYVGNGFGKAVGFTQIRELGEIETPIGLTNTLSIHTVANALTDHTLSLPGNENVRSVNPVVGETNDGYFMVQFKVSYVINLSNSFYQARYKSIINRRRKRTKF